MNIKKQIKTGNTKWPVKVVMDTGLRIKIPQQKQFNTFCQSHGCSLAAVSVALQFGGVKKNPNKVYTYAKNHISGYTGSKLTIYGAKLAIDGLKAKGTTEFVTITKSNTESAKTKLKTAIKNDAVILIEQASPIHTNVVIAKRSGGVYIATNGTVKESTVNSLVNGALKGVTGTKNQDKWYKSGRSSHAAGAVIYWPDGKKV